MCALFERQPTGNPAAAGGPMVRLIQTYLVEIVAGLYVALLLHMTFLPFDLGVQASPIEPVDRMLGLYIVRPVIPDVAGNVALYLPLGALLCATLLRRRWSASAAILFAILAGMTLSYATEYIQRWSPSRVCSLIDFFANLIGLIVGSLLGPSLLSLLHWAESTNRRDLRDRPEAVAARLVALVLFITALVPFDVAFSPSRFADAARHPHWIPFARANALEASIEAAAGAANGPALHASLRDLWLIRLDWFAQASAYALLAVLTLAYLRRHCRMSFSEGGAYTLAASGLLGAVSCAGQFFILSRGIDTTYLALALIGAVLGVAAYPIIVYLWPENGPHRLRSRRHVLLAVVTAVAIFIVLRQAAPFLPNTDADSIARQAANADRLPMGMYFRAKLPVAVDDIAHKLLAFMTFGAAAAWYGATRPGGGSVRASRLACIAAVTMAATELGQLILPARVPGVTDVLLAWFGTGAGVQAYRLAAAARAEALTAPERLAKPVRFDVELGPPEEGPAEPPANARVRKRLGRRS